MHKSLGHALRWHMAAPRFAAQALGAQIDGVYLRAALGDCDMETGAEQVLTCARALAGQ